MKTLYLLAGCNGAGKTTAAFALLPGLLVGKLLFLLPPIVISAANHTPIEKVDNAGII